MWQRATQLPDINDAPERADQGLALDAVVGFGHTEGNDAGAGAARRAENRFIIGRRNRNVADTGRLPNAHLCAAIRIHVAMPVEMIGCKIEPCRCLGAKIAGVVQAETRTLNGIHIVLVVQCFNPRRFGVAYGRSIATRCRQHRCCHQRGGGLAIGTSDCHDWAWTTAGLLGAIRQLDL